MPSISSKRAPGISSAVRRPPDGVDQRVRRPVHHQGRRGDVAQGLGARAGRADGEELPAHSGGVEAAVEGSPRVGRPTLLVGVGRAAPHVEPGDVSGDRRLPIGRRRSGEDGVGLRRRLPVLGFTGVGHHRRHRQQPVAMVDGQLLDDHPAHRQAHHVCGLHVRRVEHGDRVVGHVGEPVARAALVDRSLGEVAGQTHVAVVEADHLQAALHVPLAPFVGVVDALAAEAVDHQQDRRPGRPDGLVVDLDLTVACDAHAGHRTVARPPSSRQRVAITVCDTVRPV